MTAALFLSVCLIAACGLIYELVAGALASYLLGDSVTQFSTVIGTYLFAMGVGSWLSRYIVRGVVARFVAIELLVGVVGGSSSLLLFLAFAYTDAFRPVLYALVLAIGTLVGLEIPLLMRILRERFSFKDVVANVLTFDYIGALGASLLFPLVLVPRLGLVRSAMAFGLLNVLVGLWSTHLFRDLLPRRRHLQAGGVAALLLLGAGLWQGQRLTTIAEEGLYADPVILARDTRYQRLACGCTSPGTCSSPRVTSTATTRRWCTPGWRRRGRAGACWCWAGATGWPCARSSATPTCARSRWWTWTAR